MQRLLRDILRQLEAQLRLTVNDKGIGQVGGIAWLVIIIAVVAQQHTDTVALCIEISHHKRIASVNQRLIERLMYQAVCSSRETEIADTVECIESSEIHRVPDLRRLGILLLDSLETYLSVEITVVAQYRTCHRRAQFRIHP